MNLTQTFAIIPCNQNLISTSRLKKMVVMNKLICIFILIFGFYSCTPSNPQDSVSFNLNGKWKLSEAFISAGGPQYWIDVENGEEIEFFENGIFNSDRFIECTTGSFSIEQNVLLLKYSCSEFNPISENESGLITYKLELHSNYFVLTPTSGPICIEGCSYRYLKK